MSNKNLKNISKKKTDKNKIIRNLLLGFIISMIVTSIYYNSKTLGKYQVVGTQTIMGSIVGYNVDGTKYIYDEKSEEHYIDFYFSQDNVRAFCMILNETVENDTPIKIDLYKDSKKIGEIENQIATTEQYKKIYLFNKRVDLLRVSIKGNINFGSANIESFTADGSYSQQRLKLIYNCVIIFLVIFTIIVFLSYLAFFDKKLNSVFIYIHEKWDKKLEILLSIRKKLLPMLISFCVSVCITILYCKYRNLKLELNFNYLSIVAAVSILIFNLCYYVGKKEIKFEKLFLIIGLVISYIFVIVMPNRTNVSWDDQIHYRSTVALSHYPDMKVNVAEDDLYTSCFSGQLKDLCDYNTEAYNEFIDYDKARNSVIDYSQNFNYQAIVYIPMALVMFLLRGLGLKMSVVFIGTRLASAWFLIYVVYRGMKHLSSGKMIVAAAIMMPGVMFIVANFNYDYWLIALTTYSIEYVVGEIQNYNKYIECKDLVFIILSFILGIIVKFVYIPLLGLIAFMPKYKFKNKRQLKIFRMFIFGVVLCAIALFVYLIFGGGLGAGDMRGGDDISTVGQINYILSNPLEYTKTLLTFLKNYWSVGAISSYSVATAYILTDGWYWGYLSGFIILVMLYDRSRNNNIRWYVSLIYGGLCFATSCMVATALYVIFTSVGSTDIAGCQPRYLFPIITCGMLVMSRMYFPINIGRNSRVLQKAKEVVTGIFILVFNFIMVNSLI